nr:RNA-guided endonuclease TnpB family protein [Caldivirga maquilingensis]
MKIRPSGLGLPLLVERYMNAKRLVLKWLFESRINPNEKGVLSMVHNNMYRVLREKFSLNSRLAEDCYRDALALYKAWYNNPRKGRYPVLRNVSLWLTSRYSFSLDLEKMKCTILGKHVEVTGYPHNIGFYRGWFVKEARLVKRSGEWFLKVIVSKEKKRRGRRGEGDGFTPTGLVAVDINMSGVVVGSDDEHYVRIPTRLEDAHHYKALAELLQRKYPKRWRESRRILNRIRHFHNHAGNILNDSARKTGKLVVDIAEGMNANVIVLENLNNMITCVEKLGKAYRDKLYLMQYRRIQYWIEWQALKRGLKVIYVNPAYTSTQCPKCGVEMREVRHRWFKCLKCGYENDRDIIAIINLYIRGRGSLTLSTAPQVRDVNPNQWGEPPTL